MDKLCPLVAAPCLKEKCAWWIRLQGKNPQDGSPIDHFGCAMTWLPVLLVENAGVMRQSAAATEAMRNQMAQDGQQARQAMQTLLQRPLQPAFPRLGDASIGP